MKIQAVCDVELCENPRRSKGYCSSHYQRHYRYGNAEEPPRQRSPKTLASKLADGTPTGIPDDECWEWMKSPNDDGYGVVSHGGKLLRAHRVAYAFANNTKIPDGLVVRHRCDNPPCVNPKHLELGTHTDNIQDKINRGRTPVGAAVPTAKLTEDAVLYIRKMHADGATGAALAREFGVSSQSVWAIVHRRSWTHI